MFKLREFEATSCDTFCRTLPTLPQPQYWRLSNHSIASIVSADQPGYAWTSEARSGAVVSGALPSGMPFQQVRTLLYIQPAMPIHNCHMLSQHSFKHGAWSQGGAGSARWTAKSASPLHTRGCILHHDNWVLTIIRNYWWVLTKAIILW